MKALILSIAVTAALAGSLAACSTSPYKANTPEANLYNLTPARAQEVFLQGKTTKNDVFARLGQPTVAVAGENGGEVWRYQQAAGGKMAGQPQANAAVGGVAAAGKELTVMFDRAGLLTAYKFDELKGSTSGGVMAR